MTIGRNDLDRKLSKASEMLAKRQQVRVALTLKGRQKWHPERGVAFLNEEILPRLTDSGKCVKSATENSLMLMMMPK